MKDYDILSIREYFPSLENPSVSSWVYNQAIEIQKFGINPLVISPTPEIPNWLNKLVKTKHAWKIKPSNNIQKYLGVDVIRPPYFKLPNRYFLDYNIKQISNCVFKTANCFDTKLIHAHFGHTGVAALNLKKTKKIPLITSFYGYDLGSDKLKLLKYYKNLLKEGDLFLALSEDMKKDLIDIGFPEKKIIIHHLGINIEKFAPVNNILKENKKFIFTIVSSLEERKGIHYAIEAFKKLKNQNNIFNCELRIIGDGPYKNYLTKIADDKDIIFINNFIAKNPRELVLCEMQKCDVFILTSITLPNLEKEGTPVVLMEAQACGKPCISTYHAGIPELVINNKTGILVNERDINSITEAMLNLYIDNHKRIQFGINARQHIIESYSNDNQIPKLYHIYNSFIDIKL